MQIPKALCYSRYMPEQPQDASESIIKNDDVNVSLYASKEDMEAARVQQAIDTICKTCEWFNHRLQVCKKCGCSMNGESVYRRTNCPIMKW